MTRITRYVFRQLLVGMVFATTVFTCLIWLTQSLRFVDMIVNRGLGAGLFLYLTALLLPSFFVLILPFALFFVVAFVYSKLITDRELVVMRGVGLSHWALASPALILSLCVVAASYWLNLQIIPDSHRIARELRWDIRFSYAHTFIEEGAFTSLSDEITVYVRERAPDAQLLGVFAHDTRDEERPKTYMAERGALVEAEGGPRLVLFNGNLQEMDKQTNRPTIVYFDRHTVELEDKKKSAGERYREHSERRLDELLHPERDATIPERDYGKFLVEGHRRLVGPWFAPGLALVGLAFLLCGTFSRRTQIPRVLLALAVVVFLQGAALGLEHLCARYPKLVPLMYINALAPILLAGFVLIRSMRWRRATSTPALET